MLSSPPKVGCDEPNRHRILPILTRETLRRKIIACWPGTSVAACALYDPHFSVNFPGNCCATPLVVAGRFGYFYATLRIPGTEP